ncbi:TrkA family potassium uptake protein [Actinomyces sp. zg-332]|uniref:potassium channel family protein n=1 Tax=Actinomyces sp. zg-332 TaxID=2708340 RepID=UPI00141E9A37|nr:TrkA family potassium uptake protein [Actinomyces sp. zg-332]QPK94656.1 TrkA family potassium uptake protein [Actinomyces sp. zg-332]
MRALIAGAGSVGRSIARELLQRGHEVTLIDNSPEAMRIASVAEADWILADACSPTTLEEAGIRECDVAISATGDDKANLVISLLAKTEYAVPKTVARVNNPKNEWMFGDSWGVDVPVSTPRIMTALVEEALSVNSLVRIFNFQKSGASMHSYALDNNSPLVGNKISTLFLPKTAILSAILRNNRPMVPSWTDDIFEAGDELLLLVSEQGENDLELIEQAILEANVRIQVLDSDSSEDSLG